MMILTIHPSIQQRRILDETNPNQPLSQLLGLVCAAIVGGSYFFGHLAFLRMLIALLLAIVRLFGG